MANEDGSLTIPSELVQRWEKQISTAYEDLDENEKDSDREQVRHSMDVISSFLFDCQSHEQS
ncbi:hypothetical protein [Mycolicibacterium farcinogenes]|uniref:hypothetical protein n=1 Tax=Mycolicibacterium farcinogenes TaxID=1802 RepID=UPI0021ADCD1A|nr:hypothetical protein [Mycolicibacterium farcinogenes]